MIVSHEHRFVFVEVPRTGTTAISAELVARYGGASVGPKHAHRGEAMQLLGERARTYCWVAGVRHPMDDVAAEYDKVRGNHKGRYTDPRRFKEAGGSVRPGGRERHAFVRDSNAAFAEYFLRFHQRVYVNGWVRDQRGADLLIRFESIQEGFAELLRTVGLAQAQALPRVNATSGRAGDFRSYYPPTIQRQAVAVLGPSMLEWGYTWPQDWAIDAVPLASRAAYRLDRVLSRGASAASDGPAGGFGPRVGSKLRRLALRRHVS